MKTWKIPVEVTCVEGTQTFLVEAKTKEKALEKFKDGEGDLESENLNVMSLDITGISRHSQRQFAGFELKHRPRHEDAHCPKEKIE